jgi:hypothetical protein
MVSVMQARCLGIPAVYTDHSLFSFGDLAGVSLNKVIKTFLTDIDQCITVSHIGRDNLILRSAVDPRKIHVLPNATVEFIYIRISLNSCLQKFQRVMTLCTLLLYVVTRSERELICLLRSSQ